MVADRPRWRISPLVILLTIGLVIVLVVTFFIAIQPVSAPNDVAGAQAKALEAANGLDVLIGEYPKFLNGESSGASSALSRAETAFAAAKAELMTVDSEAVNQLAADFATLDQQYSA